MKVRMNNTPPTDYNANIQEINKQQYTAFFKDCLEKQKIARKLKDDMNVQKFKTLERCYRLMQSFGVPFVVATRMFPKMCDIISEYQAGLAKQEEKGK